MRAKARRMQLHALFTEGSTEGSTEGGSTEGSTEGGSTKNGGGRLHRCFRRFCDTPSKVFRLLCMLSRAYYYTFRPMVFPKRCWHRSLSSGLYDVIQIGVVDDVIRYINTLCGHHYWGFPAIGRGRAAFLLCYEHEQMLTRALSLFDAHALYQRLVFLGYLQRTVSGRLEDVEREAYRGISIAALQQMRPRIPWVVRPSQR